LQDLDPLARSWIYPCSIIFSMQPVACASELVCIWIMTWTASWSYTEQVWPYGANQLSMLQGFDQCLPPTVSFSSFTPPHLNTTHRNRSSKFQPWVEFSVMKTSRLLLMQLGLQNLPKARFAA
jgi:hypothetical protein